MPQDGELRRSITQYVWRHRDRIILMYNGHIYQTNGMNDGRSWADWHFGYSDLYDAYGYK